ncbi:ATP binding [Elasticomyces elasticus]|nr:ATP binding [Elasticomyces elasticus]KAK3656923.1 ATP binding [Elasticomyces elasticus]KAK4926074.1 ATP binding [Elasticomyces elasticus]KAK5766155.1 ATP binding [Elasticomyces elasticus]
MTTFASRSAFPTPTYTSTTSTMNLPRIATAQNPTHVFTSPTESEFSDTYRSTTTTSDPSSTFAAIETWDEAKVADWLRSINCAQYIPLFLQNHINGENLLEIDKNMLKEIGIKKLGDRVRINEKARQMRGRVLRRGGRRAVNRTSLATLDGNSAASALTPPSSGSPARPLHSARVTGRAEKRMSRQIVIGGGGEGAYAGGLLGANKAPSGGSRPSSPMMVDQENRGRVPRASPMESRGKEQGGAYFATGGGARQQGSAQTRGDTPQTARFAGHLKSSSTDNLNISIVGALPSDKPLIRVIYENGRSSVVNITDFRTAEDIIRATLRKGALNENHFRSYCFYVLDGTDPNPMYCRRLGEGELVKLCSEGVRSERGRLILRKIHTAEPEGEQLRQAARIAEQQRPEPPAIEVFPSGGTGGQKSKSHSKIEQLMGESLGAVSYPMSPASQAERRDYFAAEQSNKGEGLMRGVSQASSTTTSASARARKLKDFYGARPPTELITQDLTSYFPEVGREEMERTVRMSIRRSKRYSKAFSRLSTVSNFSVASSLKDAPPLPSIADHWASSSAGVGGLGRRQPGLRPFSVVHLGRSDSRGERPESFRESIASSSVLAPLDEEDSPGENRKSYVSFSAESGSETGRGDRERDVMAITDPEGNTVMQSYFDDTQSSPGNTVGAESRSSTEGSLNSRISQFIAEDGEEEDEELMELLQKNSWDDLKYMKGEMIGQGSFGTVYLALHAVTAELMAVKQVEMPSGNNNAMDAKRNNMIEALNHEITLLRDLRHPNIVQYLGSNSDEQHLNIFLEYVAGGSVASMLVNYGSLPEGLIANFVRQILCGLAYLHSEEIIHRDIKGANILVDNKGTVKISDFGISKRVEASTLLTQNSGGVVAPGKRAGGPRVSLQGSVFWMAPEVVRQTAYTKKADIWSLGCLVVEMFTGSHPHPNCTQLQAIFKIGGKGGNGTGEGARPDMPVGASEEAREFMGRTFEIEHERRPSAEELRGFRWLLVGVGKN